MRRWLEPEGTAAVVVCVAAAMWIAFVAAALTRCTPAEATDGRAEYGSANEACLRLSTSRAQFDDCVARVQDTWCGPSGLWTHPDSGVCDGGAP